MTDYNQQIRVIIGDLCHVPTVTTGLIGSVRYATYNTNVAHGYAIGQSVFVTGFDIDGYNGIFTVDAIPTTTSFRVVNATTGTPTTVGLAVKNGQYDYTVIDSLRINGGRPDITSAVAPMEASVDIMADSSLTTFTDNFGVNQAFVAQVYDAPVATWTNLFVGTVTDIDISIDQWYKTSGLYRYSISAVSAMSRLNYRAQAYSGTSAVVTAGNAAYLWIVEALNNNLDFGSGMYWYGSIGTDTPIMHKRNNGTYYDMDIIQSAASSARGNFHDRPDGRVYYTSFSASVSPTFWSLGPQKINAEGLSGSISITDVYNTCIVTSTNTAISSGSATDGPSQTKYGRRRGTRDTELDVQATVNSQATDFLAVRKTPKIRYGAVTIDMANKYLTDGDRTQLYKTRTNSSYEIAFPYQLGGTVNVLVDNWSWVFSRNRATLTMQVCPFTDLHP